MANNALKFPTAKETAAFLRKLADDLEKGKLEFQKAEWNTETDRMPFIPIYPTPTLTRLKLEFVKRH